MSTKPSWDSFFDQKSKVDSEFLLDRPSVIKEKFCMDGKIQFDGKDYYVVIPEELLDRAEIRAGDEIEILGERLSQGYRITIERAFDLED